MTAENEPLAASLPGADVTQVVIGAFFDCYNQLGIGFLESVYEGGLEVILAEAGLDVRRQEKLIVWFRGREIGHFRADLVVNDTVLVEQASKTTSFTSQSSADNALKTTKIELGLLLNFGPKPQFKRVLLTNDRKDFPKSPLSTPT
jgi:GxxExxY protein